MYIRHVELCHEYYNNECMYSRSVSTQNDHQVLQRQNLNAKLTLKQFFAFILGIFDTNLILDR